jgi:CRISPR-associated protein Cmr6
VARRDALSDVGIHAAGNPGLVMDRYAVRIDDPDHRNEAYRNSIGATQGLQVLYKEAFERWQKGLINAETTVVRTGRTGRLLIGSGETVYETSLRFHSTYGFPYIPGSALKGLASSYAHNVWACPDRGGDVGFGIDGKNYEVLFGSQKTSGLIIFHDAWLMPNSLLQAMQLDILTVHYPEYYRGKAADRHDIETDEPNPIPFVSIQGSFLLAISAIVEQEAARPWVRLARELLLEALAEWGVGAKTSAGYGRLYDGEVWQPPSKGAESVRAAAPSPSGEYEEGQTVQAVRIEETGRRAKKRQAYQIVGDEDNRGFVAGRDNDVPIGEKRVLRVLDYDRSSQVVTLEPLDDKGE